MKYISGKIKNQEIVKIIIQKIYRCVLKPILGQMARRGIVWPFVCIYSRVINEVSPHMGTNDSAKTTILALNADRFRGDLEILADTGEFRILKVPFDWQVRLLNLFWPDNINELRQSINYFNPGSDTLTNTIQIELRKFLKIFLPSLYEELGINCVIGAAKHYAQDYDWGLVSDEIGFPYIVLHRENLASTPKHYEAHYNRGKKCHKFRGTHIVVHNNIVKGALIKSGYVNADKISALGCLRMDEYVKRVKELNKLGIKESDRRKKVLLFSFNHGMGLLGFVPHWSKERDTGFIKLFEHVHVSFARLAMQNADVDFIIKLKWGGNWNEEIDYVFRKNGIRAKDIENLTILDDGINVHELILDANVICGFQSTAILEAAIAAKPVIIPYFDEALNPDLDELIHFKDYFHLFDVANNTEMFEELIVKRIYHSEIDQSCLEERYAAFEKYISTIEGDSLNKYVRTINNVLNNKMGP